MSVCVCVGGGVGEQKEVAFMRDGCSELEAKIAGRYTIVVRILPEIMR